MKHEDYSLAWLLTCATGKAGKEHFRGGRAVEDYFYNLLSEEEGTLPISEFDLLVYLKLRLGDDVSDGAIEGGRIIYDHFIDYLMKNRIDICVK